MARYIFLYLTGLSLFRMYSAYFIIVEICPFRDTVFVTTILFCFDAIFF